MALPGTVNYFEGQVSVNGAPLDKNQLGRVTLDRDNVIDTASGKAEILLSPGVVLRIGDNSEVRMLAPEMVNPRVALMRGEAMVEVDQKLKDASVDIVQGGTDTTLLKPGLYRFETAPDAVQVIDGKARVTEDGRSKEIGKGKEITLNSGPLKAISFDRTAEDDLYRWSNVRADYMAEANAAEARVVYAGAPFWGAGWYWNPYFYSWAWLPGDGLFYSPFGYPFFSPAYVAYAPWPHYFGGYRTVIAPGLRAGSLPHASALRAGGFRGGIVGGGFRGGAIGGGFHGGFGGGGRR
jgi:hypothetical protein